MTRTLTAPTFVAPGSIVWPACGLGDAGNAGDGSNRYIQLIGDWPTNNGSINLEVVERMPRRPPPPPAKGTKHPGAGRKRGTPNRISIEARTLASMLVSSPTYQARLMRDFDLRRVHPTIESLVWQYSIGKPVQPVLMAGSINMNGRLDEERRAFQALDLHDLEQLAAESQRLVDRAFELARIANGGRLPADRPLDVVAESVPANGRAGNANEIPESDNESSDNPKLDADPHSTPTDKSHGDNE